MRSLGALLLFAGLACGGSVSGDASNPGGGGNDAGADAHDAGAGGNDGPTPVPCEQAVDGDPCGPNFQMCGPQDGYGCSKFCFAGRGVWDVSCSEPPTCETSTVQQGVSCSLTGLNCGPFAINSLCGAVSVRAECGFWGWAYDLPCDPDCESLGQADCAMYPGCAWVAPCNQPNQPPVAARCIDFPPHAGFCDSLTCPAGSTCLQVGLNPSNLASGDCSQAAAAATFCVPAASAPPGP